MTATFMSLLQVLLHFVRSGKLFLANSTRKDLSGCPLVIQEGVSLEAVLIFKVLGHLEPFTLDASICAVRTKSGVSQQI